MSRVSASNSFTTRDLISGFVFQGEYDSIVDVAEIAINFTGGQDTIDGVSLIYEYSNDGVVVAESVIIPVFTTPFYIDKLQPDFNFFRVYLETLTLVGNANLSTIFKTSIAFQSVQDTKIRATNGDALTITDGGLNVNIINGETIIVSGSVSVSNFPATQAVSGTVSVNSLPAITIANTAFEVSNFTPQLASNLRTASELVVGQYFKVETLGNTIGAVWNQMGAIIGSESNPPIGRVFKCIANGNGTGTVSMIIYNENVVVANTVAVAGTFFQATQPVSLASTVVSSITDPVAVTGTFFQATQPVSGTVAISNPLSFSDPYLEISKLSIAGSKPVFLAGYNTISATNTIEDLWGSAPASWTPPSSATTVSIVSASANDTSAGTGARTVSVIGLNASYDEVSETVIMNGTTPVITVNSYFIIHNLIVLTAGSTGKTQGIISTVWTGGGTPVGPNILASGSFTAPQNASQSCIYQVPAGNTLYITNYKVGSHFGGTATFNLMAQPFGGVFNTIENAFTNVYGEFAYRAINPPMRFTEKTTIKFQTGVNLGGSASIECSGSIDGVLVANV